MVKNSKEEAAFESAMVEFEEAVDAVAAVDINIETVSRHRR
jgi:hypothetical protein